MRHFSRGSRYNTPRTGRTTRALRRSARDIQERFPRTENNAGARPTTRSMPTQSARPATRPMPTPNARAVEVASSQARFKR